MLHQEALKNQLKSGKVSSEYRAYYGMKARCYNQNEERYVNYGARGIKVCDRWLESYDNFLSDMGKKLDSKLSIERLDVNKGYSPDNCIWANATVQARNTTIRKDNTSGFKGVNWVNRDRLWRAYISVDKEIISLGYFKRKEDAVKARADGVIKYWNE